MPERRLALSRTQANDIAVICAWGPSMLTQIADDVEAIPVTISREPIQQAIAKRTGVEKAETLYRVLFGLAAVHRRRFEDVSELLDAVTPSEWDDKQRTNWQNCRPALQRLPMAEPVILATKALDLSYDVERACVGLRIVTDIRPVFDQNRNTIAGTTIRQTLRLEYTGVDGNTNSISVGLDADDVSRLKQLCEEAMQKISVVKEKLIQAGMTEIVVPGEDDDE